VRKAKITNDATHIVCLSAILIIQPLYGQPAEILLNRSPRTCLSLAHPRSPQCAEQSVELKVGDRQPRAFVANGEVLVCDLLLTNGT